jgi:hypothetical protein
MRGLPRAIAATALFLLATPALAQQPDQVAGPRMSSIGYPSVAAALTALQARRDVKTSVQDDWTVIEDGPTLWSFTPASHPAHPSVAKRTLVEKDGGYFIDMKILCQSTQSACDQLAADFQKLNEQMRASIARQHQRRAPGN